MDIELDIVLDWALFPDSFIEHWEEELNRTEPCDGGVVITLIGEYTPGCPGRYDGHPDNMYPAEAPDVEICGHVIKVRRGPGCLDRPLDEKFLSICHQFAADWLELHEDQAIERLLDAGSEKHKDEISEILAEIELDVDRRRDRELDLQFEMDMLGDKAADYQAATWAATRTNAPDEG